MALKKKKIADRLKEKYKLVVLNDDTFEEKASFTGSLWYMVVGGLALSIIIVMLTIAFIVSTPLKEYLSENGNVSRKELARAYTRADSLEKLARANEIYLNNMRDVINGKAGTSAVPTKPVDKKTVNVELKPGQTEEEANLRAFVEAESKAEKAIVKSGSFVVPLKGIITEGFNTKGNHFAVDIAAKQKAPIHAVLDGKVIFAAFTNETGYVIALQHANNFVSFYKHCSALLKKVDSFVHAGDIIAVAGNTGEYSSGPHLHFELWHNGDPVNPNEFMKF